MFGLFIVGFFTFPLSHILFTYLQQYILPSLTYIDRFAISTRIVSSLQAIAASVVGFSVVFTSTDILLDRKPILPNYACFGLSYFYYDVVVMFLGTYLEEKQRDPQQDVWHIWNNFFRKKKLIVLHHILLPIIGFPAVTVLRKNKGDFFLACVFLSELSTPFLSFKAILEKLGKKNSPVYIVNGVVLATVFLFCRVLVYPYMYWRYSKYANIPFLETPLRVPLFCTTFCLVLLSVQVYWFSVIMKGILRFFSRPVGTSQTPIVKEHGKNGVLFKNHDHEGNSDVTVNEKTK